VITVRRALVVAVCAGVVSCSPAEPPGRIPPAQPRNQTTSPPPVWRVTADGIGPVRVGMTLAEVEAAAGVRLAALASDGCEYRPLRSPDGNVLAMFTGGRVARIDVREPAAATAAGVHVGDTSTRVRELYGNAVVATPHKYTDGQYLTVPLRVSRRLIFETDGSVVTRYRAGRLPEVEWVEGCG
jgi:hypothetical protein